MAETRRDGRLDTRFSAAVEPTTWAIVQRELTGAELYWISTVRSDGRPHVTPLVGVWFADALHLTTGRTEQKFRNLSANPQVVVTTGRNTWQAGLDVVVEGRAVAVSEAATLAGIAEAYRSKYGRSWDFAVADGGFARDDGHPSAVFCIDWTKIIAFAKDPHGQTTFRP